MALSRRRGALQRCLLSCGEKRLAGKIKGNEGERHWIQRWAGRPGNKYDPIRWMLNLLARSLCDHWLYPIIIHIYARAFLKLSVLYREKFSESRLQVVIRKISLDFGMQFPSYKRIGNYKALMLLEKWLFPLDSWKFISLMYGSFFNRMIIPR